MTSLQIMALAGAGLFLALAPRARADAWDQKTKVTFSGPVEIPGRVLPPGTYVFKLADSMADRNIVEVFNKEENHLFGIFLAIPDYRLRPADKAVVTFEERVSGAPEAVKAWFYPGENYGHDFVYPRTKAVELAQANQQPVASMPDEMAAHTTKPTRNVNEPHVMALRQAPLTAQQPSRQEVAVAQAFPPKPPATQPAATLPSELPKTASLAPWMTLFGITSLGAAVLLRRASAKATS